MIFVFRMKKEAAIMAKEIEKRQKEYIEKQKMKHRSTNDKRTFTNSNLFCFQGVIRLIFQ